MCSVIAFDEKSISYACIANSVTPTTVVEPTTCTIQVTGVKALIGVTEVQEIIYNPTDLLPLGQIFNSTKFASAFTNLVRVGVHIIQAAVATSLMVAFFDNHAYTAYLES